MESNLNQERLKKGLSFGARRRERRGEQRVLSLWNNKSIADALLQTGLVQLAEEDRTQGSEGKTDP